VILALNVPDPYMVPPIVFADLNARKRSPYLNKVVTLSAVPRLVKVPLRGYRVARDVNARAGRNLIPAPARGYLG